MKLCRINRRFNEVCKKESMWRRKVKNDYGIDKKYGKTTVNFDCPHRMAPIPVTISGIDLDLRRIDVLILLLYF